METRKLRAIKLEVTEDFERACLVSTDDDLTTLQQFVDGYIEIVRIAPDAVMIVNDSGLVWGYPINVTASLLYGPLIAGNAWIFGIDSDGELQDVPERYYLDNVLSTTVKDFINNEKVGIDDEQ